jgi:transcriptional regulator with XRE-family HTH domain
VTGDPLPAFAWSVRARRKALKLTQEAAADRASMEGSYWSRIERGKIDPGLRMVTRVAIALETTPAALFKGMSVSEPMPKPRPPFGIAEMTTSNDEEIVITIRRDTAVDQRVNAPVSAR